MAKMSKTQIKRALNAIKTKSGNLTIYHTQYMSVDDYRAIERIVRKNLAKLK